MNWLHLNRFKYKDIQYSINQQAECTAASAEMPLIKIITYDKKKCFDPLSVRDIKLSQSYSNARIPTLFGITLIKMLFELYITHAMWRVTDPRFLWKIDGTKINRSFKR